MADAKNLSQEIKKLQAQAESLDQLVTLGDLYLEQGDKLEARKYYSKAMEKYPKKAEGFARMGSFILADGNLEEAENYFQLAVDKDTTNIAGRIGLAKIFMKKGGLPRANEMIDRALKIDSTHPEVVFNAGEIKLAMHDLYNAEKLFTQSAAVNTSPYYAYARFYLGLIYAKQGWLLKAEQQFNGLKENKAFADIKSPNGLALANNIALVQFRLGNYADAEKGFSEIVKNGKDVPASVYLNLAMALWVQDKTAEAVDALKKANGMDANLFPWIKETEEYLKTGAKGLKEKVSKLMKENPNGYNIGLYLGCIIPNRFPFIEAATRHFLDAVKVGVADLEGASCCPAPGVFRSFDPKTWLAVGSRNIVLSEELKRDLITMCNGCYGTLNDINHELKEHSSKKKEVNEMLAKINKEYKGNIQVRHILDLIINTIGMDGVKKMITNPVKMKVALHYGCHIVKPTANKPWKDNFEGPTFFDKLVEATGAEIIDYRDKNMCCGAGGAVRTGAKEVALDFTKEKLMNIRQAGVDAIVLCCPFCHLQYDLGETEINATFKDEIGEPFRIPIIYITQLLDIAMGMDPFRAGLLRTPRMKGMPPFTPVEPIFTQFVEDLK
jgi:heterodisulfide reductase subunit B